MLVDILSLLLTEHEDEVEYVYCTTADCRFNA